MPHDAKGNLLRPGDLVNIPCTVLAVFQDGDACNLDLELEYPMPCRAPERDRYSAINAGQVVKRVGGKIYECGCRASGSDELPEYCSQHSIPQYCSQHSIPPAAA